MICDVYGGFYVTSVDQISLRLKHVTFTSLSIYYILLHHLYYFNLNKMTQLDLLYLVLHRPLQDP